MPLGRRTVLLVASIALPLSACRGGEGKPEEGRKVVSAGEPVSAPKAARSLRQGLRPWRPLLGEAARAELRDGGLVIDFGTPDAAKYTWGGWASGWGDRREQQGTRYALVEGDGARISLRLLEAPAELLLRARAGEAQELEVWLGGARVGALEVGKTWAVARLAIEGAREGPQFLELRRRGRAGALEVDWLRLANEPGAEPAPLLPRVAPVRLGGKVRRAFLAPSARSYSFYLHVPKDAKLIFDIGSRESAEFAVRAETVGGEVRELFRERTRPGRWSEEVVDLSALAGRAVRLELATTKAAEGAGWGEPTLYVPRDNRRGRAAPRRGEPAKNLIFVVLDTTRADAFSLFDPESETEAPALGGLAATGTAFVAAYNNENWTKPSTATLLSGLYPTTHTARRAKSIVPEEVTFLSEHLQERGFTTGALLANAVVSDKFGFDRGWDQFENYADGGEANGYYLYRNAAEWLDAHAGDGRFFLYVQSIDPHTTYEVPEPFWRPYFEGRYRGALGDSFTRDEQARADRGALHLSDRDLRWVKALYSGEVTYQDRQLNELLAKVDELGLWDDTIFVVTNDHGEELMDHGHMGHGWTLHEELLRAPLTIHYPPLFPPKTEIEEVVEHVDLAPTLVEALGLEPMEDIDGVSLMPLVRGSPGRRRPSTAVAVSRESHRSIRVGRWKLIVDHVAGWHRLYDLKVDPRETRDRREDAGLAGRLCEIYLGEALASPGKAGRGRGLGRARKLQAQDAKLDPETRRQLEALGYL